MGDDRGVHAVSRDALRMQSLRLLHTLPRALRLGHHQGAASLLTRRPMCYDQAMIVAEEQHEDAVVQTSASGRPQSRMVRKMIKEIFGHPMAPTDCSVYLSEKSSANGKDVDTGIVAVFHECGSDVDVSTLNLGPRVREATQQEQSSIAFWYTARVRIDNAVAT